MSYKYVEFNLVPRPEGSPPELKDSGNQNRTKDNSIMGQKVLIVEKLKG